MKPIQFNEIQKSLLNGFLNKRKTYLSTYIKESILNKNWNNTYYGPLNSVIKILDAGTPFILTSPENLAIVSCVNENFDLFRDKFEKINWSSGSYTYLILSDEEKFTLQSIDNLHDILYQCGYYRREFPENKNFNPNYYYLRAYENIKKLRECSRVYYSEFCGSIYKLLFYTNSYEYTQFELNHGIDINQPFVKSDREYLVSKKEHFSGEYNRDQLRDIIGMCKEKHYPAGTLDLLSYILN